MKIKEGLSAGAFGTQEPRKSECLVEENRRFGGIDKIPVKFLRGVRLWRRPLVCQAHAGIFLRRLRIRGGYQII